MVVDKLENYPIYFGLGYRIFQALEYLAKTNLSLIPEGKHQIQGDDIFVLVNNNTNKNLEEGRLEAHRRYIDIHYICEGEEFIGYAPSSNYLPIVEYDLNRDIEFFAGTASMIKMEKGMFAIFFPSDLHMPGIGNHPSVVRKIVVKVRV
jgi:YhcH/YjgK/YiaL family protein